jgi:general secretion pathway protein E
MEHRLVRRVCPDCAKPYQPDAGLLRRAGFAAPATVEFRRGAGCEQCGGSGYRGRTGLFSLIAVDETVRELVMQKAPTTAIEEATRGRAAGLLEEGRAKVAAGLTTIDEVLRVVQTEA